MLAAVLIMTLLAGSIAMVLLALPRLLPAAAESPVERVNALLPQTQCAQCGYPGCRPYAEAIVQSGEAINRCPPGGDALVTELARLLGKPVEKLDQAAGPQPPLSVAVIDEDACIGCAICLAACPVDAIVGAAQYTHTVISAECTGCELCIAPCPVDCISLQAIDSNGRTIAKPVAA